VRKREKIENQICEQLKSMLNDDYREKERQVGRTMKHEVLSPESSWALIRLWDVDK